MIHYGESKHLCAGKTSTAVTLSKHYGAACLSIDEVVQETISSGNSSAGLRARKLCAQDAMEEAEVDTVATPGQGPGVLSVEAVAKHTAEGSQIGDRKVPPSSASTRNKTITGHSQNAATPSVVHSLRSISCYSFSKNKFFFTVYKNTGYNESVLNFIRLYVCLFVSGQTQGCVSVTASPDAEELTNGLLPEDLLEEILSDRLQVRHGSVVSTNP